MQVLGPALSVVAVFAATVVSPAQQEPGELPLVAPTVLKVYETGPDGLELFRIRVMAIEPKSGALWIGMGAEAEPPIRIDRKTGIAKVIGRKGSGPGEYNRVLSIVPGINGEVGIWDPGQRLWFWVDSLGRHTRRWTMPTNSLIYGGVYTDTRGNVFVKQPATQTPGQFNFHVVVRLDSAAGLRDSQAIPLRNDPKWSWNASKSGPNGSGSSGTTVQFAPTVISGIDARGRLFAAWSDSNFVILREGAGQKRLLLPDYREPLTSEEKDQANANLDRTDENFKRQGMTPTSQRPSLPSVRPQIREIIPEMNGGLAITRSRPCASVPTWRAPGGALPVGNATVRCPFVERFDADGRRMRPFTLRNGDRLLVVRGDTAWVARSNRDDLEQIVELVVPRQ